MDFNQTDRDMMIKNDVKLDILCRTLTKMNEKIDKMNEKIDNNVNTYISKKFFLAINGIIIGLLISLFTYGASINDKVIKNTVNIEYIKGK